MNYDIQKLHIVQQEILDYFVEICKKNNFDYFLLGGTALGAYRHKGFIPWDDDLDVGMPRDDYEKFISIFKNENGKFYLQNEHTESNWFLTFSKIRKKDTVFIEGYAEDIFEMNGIYIDVFPIDYLDKNRKSFLYQRYLKHCLRFNSCKNLYKRRGKIKYIFEHIICFPVFCIGTQKTLSKLNNLCIGKCKRENANFLVVYDDSVIQGLDYDMFYPPINLTFEGKEYCCPNRITDYLVALYGDNFMELPPEDERATHEAIRVEF